MKTHDRKTGKFWGIVRLPLSVDCPKVHYATLSEIEWPYREAPHTKHRRIGPFLLVTGQWEPPSRSVETHLLEAVRGHELGSIHERTES